MAAFLFTKAILSGQPIQVFNRGDMQRDFTYIDDIVEGIVRLVDRKPTGKPPYALYNIGNNNPVQLLDFIATLEDLLGIEAKKELLPMQPGDVSATYADIDALSAAVGFAPSTPLRDGLARFIAWYREYYKVEPLRY